MNDEDKSDGFKEYKRLFINTLERLDAEDKRINGKVDLLRDSQEKIRVELKLLQAKAAAIAAVISMLVAAAVKWIFERQ